MEMDSKVFLTINTHKGLYRYNRLVTGDSDSSHLENLTRILKRLEEYGLHARRDKCECDHILLGLGDMAKM